MNCRDPKPVAKSADVFDRGFRASEAGKLAVPRVGGHSTAPLVLGSGLIPASGSESNRSILIDGKLRQTVKAVLNALPQVRRDCASCPRGTVPLRLTMRTVARRRVQARPDVRRRDAGDRPQRVNLRIHRGRCVLAMDLRPGDESSASCSAVVGEV